MIALAPPTVSTFAEAYAERITTLPPHARSSRRIATNVCRYYLAYLTEAHGLEEDADPALGDVLTVSLVRGFERWLGQPGRGRHGHRGTSPMDLSRSTIRHYLVELKSFVRWCVRDAEPQLLVANPLERYRLPKAEQTTVHPYSQEEIAAFYRAVCDGRQHWLRNRAIVSLLLHTGLRESELLNLKKRDLLYDNRGERSGGGSIVILGKGSKERTVIFGRECRLHVEQYLAGERPAGQWLFPSPFDAECHLNESSLFDLVNRKWAPAAEIPHANVHRFRHTFATQYLIRHPRDLFTLQKLLGHTTLEMVRRYAEVADVLRLLDDPAYMDGFVPPETGEGPQKRRLRGPRLPLEGD